MEDEAKDSLRSLLGRGTLLASASSGCWECQCTLRESDEVDPLYRAEQSLHFRFPSGVRSKQMVLMGKLVSVTPHCCSVPVSGCVCLSGCVDHF